MNPGILKFGAAGLAAYAVYKLFLEKKQPVASDYQATTVMGPAGVPVTVATPVASAGSVTQAQATATPEKPPVPGPVQPVPTTIPGEGTVYAPHGSVTITSSGDVTQPAPIVVSPSGSSSVMVGNTLDVQRALNTLGYAKPPLVEDGILGPATTTAIKAFQSKNHLAVDGTAGPATKAALSGALLLLAGGSSVAGAIAQLGSPQTGSIIAPDGLPINTTPALKWTPRDVQHALNVLGASPKLVEDGQTGPKTVAAIKSYQTANGLTPDGIAGPKTKTALYLATSQAQTSGGALR